MARPQWKEAIRPRSCHCPFHLLPATSLPAVLFTLDTSSGNNTAQEAGLDWRVGSRGLLFCPPRGRQILGVAAKAGKAEDLEGFIPFLAARG